MDAPSPTPSAVSSLRSEGKPIDVSKLPAGEELPEGHQSWTREQLQAYLLAQQLASMQRGGGAGGPVHGWPASATPQFPPRSAATSDPPSVASTRPGTATPPWRGAHDPWGRGEVGWFNDRHLDPHQALAKQRQQNRRQQQRQLFGTPEGSDLSRPDSAAQGGLAPAPAQDPSRRGAPDAARSPPPAGKKADREVSEAWSGASGDGLLPAAQVNRLRAGMVRERLKADARAGAGSGARRMQGAAYNIITGW